MLKLKYLKALLYDKMGNLKKKEYYLDRLEQVDKDNPLFENKIKRNEVVKIKNGDMIEYINSSYIMFFG
jgi:hypothetical protein